jgi:hypothetical protein
MSTQDPIGSPPPERPKNPTHFGGEGLYEAKGDDASLKVPLGEHVDNATKESLEGEQLPKSGSVWEFARRNHVPALLAAGGIVWLIATLVRKSTRSP